MNVSRRMIEDCLTRIGVDNNDATIRSDYTGRGTFRPGLGVVLPSKDGARYLARFMFALGTVSHPADDYDDADTLASLDAMDREVMVDAMGLNLIVYFPGIGLTIEEAERNAEECDEEYDPADDLYDSYVDSQLDL